MSTSRRRPTGPSQGGTGTRRPRVAGLRKRSAQESPTGSPDTPVETTGETATPEKRRQGPENAESNRDDAQQQEPNQLGPEVAEADRDTRIEPTTESVVAAQETTEPETAETAPTADGTESAEPDGSLDSPEPSTEPGISAEAGDDSGGDGHRTLHRPHTLVPVMLVLAMVCGGLAAWFHHEAYALRHQGAAANEALVNQAATSQVKGQVETAVEKLFSYDYANTAKTEKAAKNLLAGKAVKQYENMFSTVKKQAPKQKLVLTTTVRASGVTRLQDDRAQVLLFVDQNATRTDNGESNVGPAQISVHAEKHGDRWKIIRIVPR